MIIPAKTPETAVAMTGVCEQQFKIQNCERVLWNQMSTDLKSWVYLGQEAEH